MELNHRHKDFQSFALPSELPALWRKVQGSNLHDAFCVNGLANRPFNLFKQLSVAERKGFEPLRGFDLFQFSRLAQ